MTKVTIAGLILAAALAFFLTPKTDSLCFGRYYICALLRESLLLFWAYLKGAKHRLTYFGRKLIYTTGREWILDETESAITE